MSVCTACAKYSLPAGWSPVQIAARCWALSHSAAGPSGVWRRSSGRAGCALGTQGSAAQVGCHGRTWLLLRAGLRPAPIRRRWFCCAPSHPGRRRRARWAETLFFSVAV